jgi:hypothetical protein
MHPKSLLFCNAEVIENTIDKMLLFILESEVSERCIALMHKFMGMKRKNTLTLSLIMNENER